MTPAEAKAWVDLVAKVELRLPFPAVVSARISDYVDGVEVRLVFYVPDRETREPAKVIMSQVFEEPVSKFGQASCLDRIWYLVRKALEHELDESFRFDGKLVRDPHAMDGVLEREFRAANAAANAKEAATSFRGTPAAAPLVGLTDFVPAEPSD